MKKAFIDSNVFLRYFAKDDDFQYSKVEELLYKAADGKIELITGPPVLFEVAWTMRSAYNCPREKALDALQAITEIAGLKMLDAETVTDAINLAKKSGQEFADAYIVVSAASAAANEIASFNKKHFERMGVALYKF